MNRREFISLSAAVADRFGIGTAKRVLREVRESISNGVG